MAHADNLRRHFPAVRSTTYLNSARAGLLPDVSIEAAKGSLDQTLQEGRTSEHSMAVQGARRRIRQELAHAFFSSSETFALTQGLSHAVHLVLWGLDLQDGDELILSTLLSQDVLLPVFVQKQQRNIKLRYVDGLLPPQEWVEQAGAQMGSRTRLVICPQVCGVTGNRFPLEQMISEAKSHEGVSVLVDGSQGAGATSLRLDALDVDFYVMPANKWLCGPSGLGVLYMNPGWFHRLDATFPGSAALLYSQAYDLTGSYLPAAGASRLEGEFGDLCGWAALASGLEYMRVTVGWDYAYTRIHGLSGELFDRLLDIDGVRLRTLREARAGIISFQIAGVQSQKFVKDAKDRQIEIESVPLQADALGGVIRVSPGLYNSSDDLNRLIKLVEEYAAKRH